MDMKDEWLIALRTWAANSECVGWVEHLAKPITSQTAIDGYRCAQPIPPAVEPSHIFGLSEKLLDLERKSVLFLAGPTPQRGRIMVVTYAGWDAVDAGCVGA